MKGGSKNRMSRIFRDTITLYNKYSDNGIEKWQRTVIKGVFWNAIKGAVTRRTGVSSADSLQLFIPFSAKVSRIYKPPKAWQALADKSGFWTIKSEDTVVKGEINTEVVKSSSELKAFDDCLTVTSVDVKDVGNTMSHFEVSGK